MSAIKLRKVNAVAAIVPRKRYSGRDLGPVNTDVSPVLFCGSCYSTCCGIYNDCSAAGAT